VSLRPGARNAGTHCGFSSRTGRCSFRAGGTRAQIPVASPTTARLFASSRIMRRAPARRYASIPRSPACTGKAPGSWFLWPVARSARGGWSWLPARSSARSFRRCRRTCGRGYCRPTRPATGDPSSCRPEQCWSLAAGLPAARSPTSCCTLGEQCSCRSAGIGAFRGGTWAGTSTGGWRRWAASPRRSTASRAAVAALDCRHRGAWRL
jgi:hypothetical protein